MERRVVEKLTDRCKLWEHQLISTVGQNFMADIDHYLAKLGVLGRVQRLSAFLRPELKCQVIYRLSYYFYVCVRCIVGHLLSKINFILHRASSPAENCIGPGCRISHPVGVIFHGVVGRRLGMAACFGHSDTDDGRLELRDRITIGAHAVLTGSFQVLDDPRISPYSVLRNEVPEYSIVASSALRMRLKRRLDERLEH